MYHCTMFDRNEILVQRVCRVLARSVVGNDTLPSASNIYSTPGRLSFSQNSSMTSSGKLFKRNVIISFPGISTSVFDNISKLLDDDFQIIVKYDTGDYFEVASPLFPMSISTSYSHDRGFIVNFSGNSPITVQYLANYDENEQIFDSVFDFNLN